MTFSLRRLTLADEPILWTMLMHAACESSLDIVRQQPSLARYVSEWGRTGDVGFIAETPQEAIGAAWLRCWTGPDKGYGYVDATIPELSIAVLPSFRGQGIGTQLLQVLLAEAQGTYTAISLSVLADNPAIRLYERLGFSPVEDIDLADPPAGTSITMVCHLCTA